MQSNKQQTIDKIRQNKKKMKNKILTLITVAAMAIGLNSNAQTNEIASGKSESGGYEFTLGGGGVTVGGETQFGVDFSLSSNPFESAPNIWIGFAQGVSWEPAFYGSTDVFIDFSTHIYKNLYLNVGWAGGVTYSDEDCEDTIWRTGPEAILQYYIGENAFIYTGCNYDLDINDDVEEGFRYSVGIGICF